MQTARRGSLRPPEQRRKQMCEGRGKEKDREGAREGERETALLRLKGEKAALEGGRD